MPSKGWEKCHFRLPFQNKAHNTLTAWKKPLKLIKLISIYFTGFKTRNLFKLYILKLKYEKAKSHKLKEELKVKQSKYVHILNKSLRYWL